MRDFAIAQAAPGHWRPWELLTQVVKTGAMDNLAAQVAAEVTRAIDFSSVGRVVDAGE